MNQPAPSLPRPLTVSELTRRIKSTLEAAIPHAWVSGEITNLRDSTHLYFSLKDGEAVLPCALWRSYRARLGFEPANGMEVIASGRVEVYPPHGKYQLIVEKLEPLGVGALQLRFEQLKERLAKEGLFNEERKRPLPPFPRTIALVTSPDGAAVRDMLRILSSRYPKITVLICPVPVQGPGAAEQIARAIGTVNLQRPDVDVLIVGRGGGSLEDLWAFNEEVVARAIHSSRIPLISAVGHETDFTIADFVADVRAATPTDGANRAVPDLRAVLDALRRHEEALTRRPQEIVAHAQERLDDLKHRLGETLTRRALELRRRIELLAQTLALAAPQQTLRRYSESLVHLTERLRRAIDRLSSDSRRRVGELSSQLEALSPLKVLARGYSITLDSSGHSVIDAARLNPGDEIRTRLHNGLVRSHVDSIER